MQSGADAYPSALNNAHPRPERNPTQCHHRQRKAERHKEETDPAESQIKSRAGTLHSGPVLGEFFAEVFERVNVGDRLSFVGLWDISNYPPLSTEPLINEDISICRWELADYSA